MPTARAPRSTAAALFALIAACGGGQPQRQEEPPACVGGGACALAGDPCHPGSVSCATGAPVCEAGAPLPDWTSCGAGLVCRGGACVATPASCSDCHGSAANAAPPRASDGSTSGVKVGAHQAHVVESATSPGFACTECHPGGQALDHASGQVELQWGTAALNGFVIALPAYPDAAWEAAPTCTNYCHGAQWQANAAYRGNRPFPSWLDGAQARACDACHRFPPGSSAHAGLSTATNCGACHYGYDCTTGNAAACQVPKATHVFGGPGVVMNDGCFGCHGRPARSADPATLGAAEPVHLLEASPPIDTSGDTASLRVGAHLAHVDPAASGPQVAAPARCLECHGAAVGGYALGHSDAVTQVSFADATWARLGGVAGSWTPRAGTTPGSCVTYCHGASLTPAQRGTQVTWSWSPALKATCQTCHGMAPADPAHASVSKTAPASACNPCHNTVVNTSGGIIFTGAGTAATTLHLDGKVQETSACTSCHGSVLSIAPPVDTQGRTSSVAVGAHQRHLAATLTAPITCAECHALPLRGNHANAAIDFAWSGRATSAAVIPTPASLATFSARWSWEQTPTCTNYCHGGAWLARPQYRGNRTNPLWVDGASARACDACHLAPPRSTAHLIDPAANCSTCHAGYDCTPGNLGACTVNRAIHVGGRFDCCMPPP